jgi:hypothetical protein
MKSKFIRCLISQILLCFWFLFAHAQDGNKTYFVPNVPEFKPTALYEFYKKGSNHAKRVKVPRPQNLSSPSLLRKG